MRLWVNHQSPRPSITIANTANPSALPTVISNILSSVANAGYYSTDQLVACACYQSNATNHLEQIYRLGYCYRRSQEVRVNYVSYVHPCILLLPPIYRFYQRKSTYRCVVCHACFIIPCTHRHHHLITRSPHSSLTMVYKSRCESGRRRPKMMMMVHEACNLKENRVVE